MRTNKKQAVIFFTIMFVSIFGQSQELTGLPSNSIEASKHEVGVQDIGLQETDKEKTKHKENRGINTLPIVAHLEGVGSIAGVAVKTKLANEKEVLVALAAGDAKGILISASNIRIGGSKLSLLAAVVQDATLKTQYGRGTDLGTEYNQSLNGLAHLASLKTKINQQQYWYASMGLSLVSLQGYKSANDDTIKINQAGLHDVFTLSTAIGFTYDERNTQVFGASIKGGVEVAGLLLRPGQSDQGQINYHTSWLWRLNESTRLSSYIRGSHGFVLAKKAQYDQLSEVISEIDGQCDSLANLTDQQNCFQLELDLASYIVTSNKKGNAQPLGGAYGLRSYSEQYIKAANTLLEGVELTYQLPWLKNTPQNTIELVAFSEIGQASDSLNKLTDDTLYSYGAGLRLNIKGTPVRLEAAKGSDETHAWYLTVGKRW